MSSLLHLAVAQLAPRKADYRHNLARLGEIFAQVDGLSPRPMLLCLAEAALTGYFLEGGIREQAMTAGALARDLDRVYRDAVPDRPLDVALGFFELWKNRIYNSALYATLGAEGGGPIVRHVHRKLFLPTYGMFDEERFMERGTSLRAFDTPWGRAALLVCEDAWHAMTATIAALDGAQLVIVPSAPPARGPWPRSDGVPGPATVSRWERLARDIAEEHGIYVAFPLLVGCEGGKMFPGGSIVAGPQGELRGRGPVWDEGILTATLDLADVTRARAAMPLLTDLEVMVPHLVASLEAVRAGAPARCEYDQAENSGLGTRDSGLVHTLGTSRAAVPGSRVPDPESRIPSPESRLLITRAETDRHTPPVPLEIDPALTADWLVRFIRGEMARRSFDTAVVGVSGGVDSAVTAYLAARALGPERVLAVRMPYRTSSPESLEHAQLVIDASGVRSCTADISAAVDGYLALQADADDTRRGNVMARMRMIVLFDLAAKLRAVPLGTGNKTERLLGYFTWHADDAPPINPLGDLFKTQVWALARYLGVPEEITAKPPTADLVAGQTDEGDLGIAYARADEILGWMLAGYGADELVARGLDREEVLTIRRRLEGTHWKRRPPTVAMVSPTAIGEAYLRPVDY